MRSRLSSLLILILILALTMQCAKEEQQVDMKQVAEKIRSAFNGGDATAFGDLVTEDFINNSHNLPEPIHGKQGLVDVMKVYMDAIPDIHLEYELILSDGDYLVCERFVTGTFTEPLSTPQGDIPPTGNKFSMHMLTLHKVTPEGLLSEIRDYYDVADFYKQLGLEQ